MVTLDPSELTNLDNTLRILFAFIGWASIYLTLCTFNSRVTLEWHCRTVTMIHATLIVTLCSYCGFVQGPWPFDEPGGPNTVLQHISVTICLGYFIFDLSWCLYHKTEGVLMLLHHILSIIGQSVVIYKGRMGTEMIATLFGTEITNPLLQIRWFLRESGLKKAWYYEVNDAIFICLFGVMRIILASQLLYTYLPRSEPMLVGKFGGVCIYLIGWIFWIMILKYAYNRYSKMYLTWKKGVGKKHDTQVNGMTQKTNGRVDTSKRNRIEDLGVRDYQ